eukprot:3387842-Amphidinium_carterae.1
MPAFQRCFLDVWMRGVACGMSSVDKDKKSQRHLGADNFVTCVAHSCRCACVRELEYHRVLSRNM